MPVQFNDAETFALIQIVGQLPVSVFDTPSKKSVLHKLMSDAAVQIDTSRCIGDGKGAVFMLENVAPGEVVTAIKFLRAVTGWGLKEAKDAFDAADPHRQGGTLGPFRSSVPSFEGLVNNYNRYQEQFKFITGIRMVAV